MNYIEKVTIKKFWGDKLVNLKFENKENFLIGVNGSGKTTIINLIVSVLEANFTILDETQFESISLFLKPTKKGQKKSRLVVTKKDNDLTPFPNIIYQIFEGREKVFEIHLDDLAEERIYRNRNFEYERVKSIRNYNAHSKDLNSFLSKLFNVTWLSIHRGDFNSNYREERNKESLVDIKLREFSRNFTGYLNEINREAKGETDEFQKHIFLSLISTETESQLYNTLDKIDIKKEKEDLAKIYTLFNLKTTEYESKLNKYANEYEKLYEKRKDKSLSFNDAEYLIGMKRIHSVIQKWQELLKKQNVIYQSKETFILIINELLQRKDLIVNERNELIVKTQSEKEFDLKFLSSGEKQLVIIFGEALLQKHKPHIFIADEPELSLHIEWQEKLVSSLKLLNPFAQLIFATHSPDVVGGFQDSVVQIENCIS
jgi:predicted ATP-dependent endonuclease of OLD family